MPSEASPSRRRSHWLFRLLGILGWVLAIGTFLLCIPTPLGPAKLGFTIVSGHSMEPTYWTNDIVVTWRTGDYSVGEPIVYTIPADEPGAGFNVVHRITAIRANGTFQTWGDNNAEPDMWQPRPDDVKGHVFFHIPKIGLVFHPGVLPLALAGIAGIFVSMSVWNWLDDGTDEDGDDGPGEGGPQPEPRRHRGVRTALSMRRRVARVLRGALRIPPPKHARPRPAWRRRVTLGLAAVLLGTAGAAHATSLGGIRAANMFAMSAGVSVTAPPPPATALGTAAIIEGGASNVSFSGPQIQGDVVLNTTDSFQCSTQTTIDGSLVLPRGSVNLSNDCAITGDLIAYGDISILNTTVAIGGSVISTHGDVRVEGATIKGSVEAYGGVTLNNSVTVGGDVIAEGKNGSDSAFKGSSSSMKTVGGSVRIGGPMSELDLVKVGGSIAVAGKGSTSVGAVGPTVTAGGADGIRLAGTCTTCNATPKPQVGQSVSAPTFPAPPQLGQPTWVDYPYVAADWKQAGWNVVTAASSQCDSSLAGLVDGLSKDTVIDATACGSNGLRLYGAAFALKASVTLVASAYSAQQLAVTSADGKSHVFNLITPDTKADGAPTCTGADSTVTAATLGAHISGVAYTPCTLAWGSAGGDATRWTGQLVAGDPDYSGSSSSVTYAQVPLPTS